MLRWSAESLPGAVALRRRGVELGYALPTGKAATTLTPEQVACDWLADQTVFLPGALLGELTTFQEHIEQAHRLMRRVQDGESLDSYLHRRDYQKRLQRKFELRGTVHDQADCQEIEKIFVDGLSRGKPVAEQLWIKAAWLSTFDGDGSVRFRFSFGFESAEDVAADPLRQWYAARLTEVVFPEAAIIERNEGLLATLAGALNCQRVMFGERIIYFNAPNGGAQFHHDVERGHHGVIFVQMSGRTLWLSLPKPILLDHLQTFIADEANEAELQRILPGQVDELRLLAANRQALGDYLNRVDRPLAEAVTDRSPIFTQRLFAAGYGYLLNPGDVLLLPQRDLDFCAWHTVYCAGDTTGEALSFAMRPWPDGFEV